MILIWWIVGLSVCSYGLLVLLGRLVDRRRERRKHGPSNYQYHPIGPEYQYRKQQQEGRE